MLSVKTMFLVNWWILIDTRGDNVEWMCIEIYNSQEVQEESNQIKDILFI